MKTSHTERRTSRSVFRRIGTYLPVLIVLGLAVPTLIYLLFMQSMGWRSPMVGIKGAISYLAPSGNDVVLYASSNTRTYFARIGGNYEVLLNPWRDYFLSRELDFKEIRDVSQLRRQKGGVLVLPSAVSLSDEERAEILAYRSKGGAVLVTWASGSRNSRGDWQGWQFLENLGAKMLGEIPAAADIHNLILNGESPLSHTRGAGQRIELSKTSEALLRLKGEMVAGRFMNRARVSDDARQGEGAIVFTEASRLSGRVAFFAFAESSWESHPLVAYAVIDDTLQWLRREPVIVRAAWPHGKRAAQVIEMDTEEGFANALPFASMLQSINYRGTFYVVTSIGKLFPGILTQLGRDFELGYMGDVPASFKGQASQVQEQRLQAMRSDLAALLPDTRTITGFRAPAEGYDATTESLLRKSGIRHHVADPNRTEDRLPLLAVSAGVEPENALVVLPRTQRDDISLYAEKLSAKQVTKALIDDADLAFDTGALSLLSVHSQNFNPGGVMATALPEFLEHLKQRGEPLWLASAGQVADWWRDRDRFKFSTSNSGRRVEFNITITGTEPVNGASLMVMLPQKDALPTVEGAKIGMVKPSVSRIDDYRAAIVFDSLKPGSYVYQATFVQK